MFLEQHIGKEVVLTLRPGFPGRILRVDGVDPESPVVALETLAGVDGLGLWVERTGDEHALDPSAILHVLVRWEWIVDMAVVVSGQAAGAHPSDPLSIRGRRTGFGADRG